MEFFKDGEPIELSKTDQKLLRVLCENRGKVLKREYLIDEVWQGDTEFVDAHALTVAVKRLRDKLEMIRRSLNISRQSMELVIPGR